MAFYRKDFATLTEEEKIIEIRKEMDYRVTEKTRYHYHIAVELFNTYSFLREEWYHFPEEHFIKDRFVKKILLDEMGEESFPIPPAVVPKNVTSGLYLIGMTAFNPFTDEHFYWLKVGKSESSIAQRLKTYGTYTPTLWKIAYKEIVKKNVGWQEKKYQNILATIGDNTNAENSKEWYQVSRENYLKASVDGFKFLESLFPYLF